MYFDNILLFRIRTVMVLYQKTQFTYKITYEIDPLIYFEA